MHLGSYAQWQLARPATPRSIVEDLARRATGTEIDQLERIIEGYSNEVYRVRGVDGHEVVVRLRRFDDDLSSERTVEEAWAIDRAREAGVPTGEVLLIDTIEGQDETFPVMVQRAVPGRPLGEVVDALSEQQRHAVLYEVGELIARLGTITLPDPPGSVLCHGDLSAKHIFVTTEPTGVVRVSGFIDFGDWTPGPPGHDLAVLRARSPELDLEPVLAGFSRRRR